MSQYKTVFLDVGGTLLKTADAPHRVYLDILREHGYAITLERARACLEEARELAASRVPTEQPGNFTISSQRQTAYRTAMVELFLDRAGVSHGFEACLESIQHSWVGTRIFELYPEVPDALTRLKEAGLTLAVVSNWEARLAELLAAHGIRDCFDFIVVSEVEGYVKPGPRLFELALERAGMLPGEVLHVGDRPGEDISAAESLGIRAVHIQRGDDPPLAHSPRIKSLDALVPLATASALLRGRVERGKGEARRFTQLDWVREQISERIGFDLFAGTLNVRLVEARDLADWQRVRQSPGVALEPSPGYCAARCYPAWAEGSVPCAIVLPQVPGYPADIVELVSPLSLREVLDLADDDPVSVAVLRVPDATSLIPFKMRL